MSEPEKASREPYGPRAPSSDEINERSAQLLEAFDEHASQVRAELTREQPAALGSSGDRAISGVFETWVVQKLARAELYLEYYGSLLIAIGKKFPGPLNSNQPPK